MGEFPSGQRGQTVNLLCLHFGGSNPPSPTRKPDAKASGFQLSVPHMRNVKRPSNVKCASRVKCACGTTGGTLNFTLRRSRKTSLRRKAKLHLPAGQTSLKANTFSIFFLARRSSITERKHFFQLQNSSIDARYSPKNSPDGRRGFFQLSVPPRRNVKRPSDVKCASRVKCACGTTGGTLNFTSRHKA